MTKSLGSSVIIQFAHLMHSAQQRVASMENVHPATMAIKDHIAIALDVLLILTVFLAHV